MSDLATALAQVATYSPLLVASDYDGVLAPIVNDPAAAAPDSSAIVALADLAASAGVTVAVISGRTLTDLRRLTGEPPGVSLIGSHGAETDVPLGQNSADTVRLVRIVRDMQLIGSRFPGSWVEEKPAGVAFHYRNVAPHDHDDAARAVLHSLASDHSDLRVMEGKKIVEVSLSATHKGDALARLRTAVGAAAVVFLGDDVTDEDAFATLRPVDVGVKVGPEPTAASHRIADQAAVAGVLQRLASARAANYDLQNE